MTQTPLAAALGADFEVILADRLGVILAESGAPNPDAFQAFADAVRDVARELVLAIGDGQGGEIDRREWLDDLGALQAGFIFGDAAKVRAAAVQVAAKAFRYDPACNAGAWDLAAQANGEG